MSKKVFNMAGGKHSAAAYAAFENRLYGGSVKATPESFVVSAGSGMNANIAVGDGLIDTGNNYARRIQTDAVESVAVAAASGSFARIDSVVAYIDTDVTPNTSVTDNTNDILKFASVAGTAASTPVAPTGAAILTAIGAGKPYMILANILVPQSAANLSGATFTNMARIAKDNTGWVLANEAWAYSSYNSTLHTGVITVPTDATLKYSIGQWVRFYQPTGGTKWGRILAVTSTTITVAMSGSSTLANEAITSNYYSMLEAPAGAPSKNSFIYSYTNGGTGGGTFYFLNDGETKRVWGEMTNVVGNSGGAGHQLLFPTGFFTTAPSVSAVIGPNATTNGQWANIGGGLLVAASVNINVKTDGATTTTERMQIQAVSIN